MIFVIRIRLEMIKWSRRWPGIMFTLTNKKEISVKQDIRENYIEYFSNLKENFKYLLSIVLFFIILCPCVSMILINSILTNIIEE